MNAHTNSLGDAFTVLLALSSSELQISEFEFATLKFAPMVEQRSDLGSIDRTVIATALELRETLRLPFWDGIMLAASQAEQVPKGALSAANFHQSLSGETRWIKCEDLSYEFLTRLSESAHNKGKLLAVTSLVRTKAGVMKHLPMLDFHTGYSAHATRLVMEVLRLLNSTGVLLRSGKSYHFYGDRLLDGEENRRFLGQALLFEPIIDRAWIAHQLIEGRCALRISPRKEYGGVPTVVELLSDYECLRDGTPEGTRGGGAAE